MNSNRDLFNRLAAICPEHVYDLEHLVQQVAAEAWDGGYDAPREKRWLGPSGSNAYMSSPLPRSNPYRAGEGTAA